MLEKNQSNEKKEEYLVAREISKEKKKILGPMIRLERQRLRLTRKQIITDGQDGQICSATILYCLEKGRVIQESDVYFNLFHPKCRII